MHAGSPIFSSSFPPGEPTFSTNSPSASSSSSAMNSPMDKSPIDKSPVSLSPRAPEARSSNRTRKSDKDSKLEIMRADLKDDLMAEINASLADGEHTFLNDRDIIVFKLGHLFICIYNKLCFVQAEWLFSLKLYSLTACTVLQN